MRVLRDQTGQGGVSFLLFLVLCSLVAGGFYMLDQMELVDVEELVYSGLDYVPGARDYFISQPADQLELRQERLRRMKDSLAEREAELEQRRRSIEKREEELEQRLKKVQRQEQEIAEREKALASRRDEFTDREDRFAYLAELYQSMPPAEASARLSNIDDDQVVISVLRQMEQRNASFILSEMDSARVSVLTRKMANSP